MSGTNKLVFVQSNPFQPSVIEHSNLLDPFLSYEVSEVLLIRPSLTIRISGKVEIGAKVKHASLLYQKHKLYPIFS
jgi:hypothetical protein